MIKILCNGLPLEVEDGASVLSLLDRTGHTVKDPKTGKDYPVLACLVDHKLKELNTRIFFPHEIRLIGYNHPDGRRTYIRSLCFVLQIAVRRVFPNKTLLVQHSLPSGLYCELEDNYGHYAINEAEILRLEEEMRKIVGADLPFERAKLPITEACAIFEQHRQPLKAELQKSLGRYFSSVYYLDGIPDSFHGPLVPSTGMLDVFHLLPYYDGFCLQYPADEDIRRVVSFKEQGRLTDTLREYARWCRTVGIEGVGSLNHVLLSGKAIPLINLCEAHQEREYARIADRISAERDRIKIVFLAGPSSSGKTSSSLRLAQQCKVLGLNPKVIELDNYFVSRELTPVDEDGQLDFEALEAMDLELLNQHLNALLSGEAVEIPRYDFKQGEPFFEGNWMHLEQNDILVMEGIHALDPEMVPEVDQSRIFRVYASALTSLHLDENNNLSTTDNRLLRRMVRDNRVRGISPEDTILRWPSVRRGENRYIFPFQENADAQFNSALLYELPLLKYYAEPLLRRIRPDSAAYTDAIRLLKFLEYIVALQPEEIAAIPPTSIMREFIGGQTL